MKRDNKTIAVFVIIAIIVSLIRIYHHFDKLEKEQHEQEVREANEQLQLWNEYRATKENQNVTLQTHQLRK